MAEADKRPSRHNIRIHSNRCPTEPGSVLVLHHQVYQETARRAQLIPHSGGSIGSDTTSPGPVLIAR